MNYDNRLYLIIYIYFSIVNNIWSKWNEKECSFFILWPMILVSFLYGVVLYKMYGQINSSTRVNVDNATQDHIRKIEQKKNC